MINFKLLPHELKQEHKTGLIVLKVLKVAHEQFTWSGGEIPHIGRYGGHKMAWVLAQGLDAREVFPLSIGCWLARLGSKHKS